MRANYWLLIFMVVAVAVATIFMWDSDPETRPKGPAPYAVAPGPEEGDATGEPSAANPTAPQGIDIPPPALEVKPDRAPLIVDSFPLGSQHSLDAWRGIGGSAGHFDRLDLLAGGPVPESGVPPDAVLIAQGWAGDPELGLRLNEILLARCGRIVARAQVTLARPDVATAVHPNLARSGWEAQLFAGDLPSCGDDRLMAWAVLPGKPALLISLIGQHAVAVADSGESDFFHVPAQTMLRPDSYPPPVEALFEILASRANLRKCGSTRCPVVAQIDGGTYSGVVLEDNGTWSLVGFGDRQGWLFNNLYRRAQ